MASNNTLDSSMKLKYEDKLAEKDNEIQTLEKQIA